MSVEQRSAAAEPLDVTTWGDRLRRIRLNRHMDQAELAEVVGVVKGTIGKYELMAERPRGHRLIENSIELRFGREAADFLRGCPQSTDYGTTRADWALAS